MSQDSLSVTPALWMQLQTLEVVEGEQMRGTSHDSGKKREGYVIKSI